MSDGQTDGSESRSELPAIRVFGQYDFPSRTRKTLSNRYGAACDELAGMGSVVLFIVP